MAEIRVTPCCQYKIAEKEHGPIFWNPFNAVVQCHNCGHAYDSRALTPPPEQGDREALVTTLCECDCILYFGHTGRLTRSEAEQLADAIIAAGFKREGG